MALKDLLALADDKLHELFSQKPHDPTKARDAFNKRIDKTGEQFASATPTKGRKMFVIKNGVVKVTLPFEIQGKSEFLVPSERFTDWLGHLKDSVTKGELDDALKSEGAAATPTKTTRKPREGGSGKGWSEERRARFAASIAARNAAKK